MCVKEILHLTFHTDNQGLCIINNWPQHNTALYGIWGGQRFGAFNYLYLGSIRKSYENIYGAYAKR